jgi:hypothetical protein
MPKPRIGLQVIAMILTAALPVAWLVGRRTAPAVRVGPLLIDGSRAAVVLEESRRGMAAGGALTSLAPEANRQEASRVEFLPVRPGQPLRPPYRLRLEGPDGGDLWQGTWIGGVEDRGPLELIVPGGSLRPGRYALRVEDAGGTVRSYLLVVSPPAPSR